jgi:hypothetical protein
LLGHVHCFLKKIAERQQDSWKHSPRNEVQERQPNELHQPHEAMPTEMLLGVSLFSPAENRSSKSRELAGKTQMGGFPLKFRTHWYLKEHHNPGDP